MWQCSFYLHNSFSMYMIISCIMQSILILVKVRISSCRAQRVFPPCPLRLWVVCRKNMMVSNYPIGSAYNNQKGAKPQQMIWYLSHPHAGPQRSDVHQNFRLVGAKGRKYQFWWQGKRYFWRSGWVCQRSVPEKCDWYAKEELQYRVVVKAFVKSQGLSAVMCRRSANPKRGNT